MGINVTCTPGPNAQAAVRDLGGGDRALVLYLDPMVIGVQVPPFPGGRELVTRWCRELAREAVKLADALDEPQWPDGARHRVIGDGDSGGQP